MGKRKSARKPVVKVRAKIDKSFDCAVCQHEKCIQVTVKHGDGLGHLRCTVCGESWAGKVTALDDPIDVYHMWIDAVAQVSASVPHNPEEEDDNWDEGYGIGGGTAAAELEDDGDLPDLDGGDDARGLKRQRVEDALSEGSDAEDDARLTRGLNGATAAAPLPDVFSDEDGY